MQPIDRLEAHFVVGGWFLLFVYWYVLAPREKRTAERQSFASALGHRVPVAASYLFLLTGWHSSVLHARWLPDAAWHGPLGAAIALAGLILALWARRVLGGNWSSAVTLKQDHAFVRHGRYRFVRNPIYTGILTMVVGTAIQIAEVRCLLAIALVATGFWIKIRQEEAVLSRQFPEDFARYRRQAAALIPFLL